MQLLNDKHVRLVLVSIEFVNIGEIDVMEERYDAEIKIKSRWYDDEEIEVYDSMVHWNPRFFIVNAMPDVKQDINYRVEKLDGKSIVTEIRVAKGNFWERFAILSPTIVYIYIYIFFLLLFFSNQGLS